MLSVSPIVEGARRSAESDMLARVADGETLVDLRLHARPRDRERRASGSTGGWFGRGTVVTRKRVELVILLTPRIVTGVTRNNMYEELLRVLGEAVQPDAGSEVSLSQPVARQRVRSAPVRHPPPRGLRRRHRRHRHRQDDAVPRAARADRSDDVHRARAESVPVRGGSAEADPPGLRRHLARRSEGRPAGGRDQAGADRHALRLPARR